MQCVSQMYFHVFVSLSVSVRLSVSHSSIWILLIPFPSSNPSFSLSSSHTLVALSLPSSPPPLLLCACLIAAVCCSEALRLPRGCDSLGSLLQINTLWWTDAWVPGPEEQDGDDRLTWVGPGPNVSTDSSSSSSSSGQRQPLGQMVRTRVIATVHQMCPLALSCLAMALGIMSQWNQRKLAPNYRLLCVKNGTGAAGVCQRVEAGWLTHCGTEACRPRRGHAEHAQRPRRRRE